MVLFVRQVGFNPTDVKAVVDDKQPNNTAIKQHNACLLV